MQHRTRALWILLCLGCGFTVISFNLIQIQLVEHDKFWQMAIKNHLHPETIPARRGTIFDSDGNLLAQTQQVYDVRLDGQILDQPEVHLPQIAQILQLSGANLAGNFNPRNRDQLLASNVDDGIATQLKALKLKSLIFVSHDRRFYPNTELASHVLGFMSENGHGEAGIEKEMDKMLSGVPGERWVESDGKGKEVAGYQTSETPAHRRR